MEMGLNSGFVSTVLGRKSLSPLVFRGWHLTDMGGAGLTAGRPQPQSLQDLGGDSSTPPPCTPLTNSIPPSLLFFASICLRDTPDNATHAQLSFRQARALGRTLCKRESFQTLAPPGHLPYWQRSLFRLRAWPFGGWAFYFISIIFFNLLIESTEYKMAAT